MAINPILNVLKGHLAELVATQVTRSMLLRSEKEERVGAGGTLELELEAPPPFLKSPRRILTVLKAGIVRLVDHSPQKSYPR